MPNNDITNIGRDVTFLHRYHFKEFFWRVLRGASERSGYPAQAGVGSIAVLGPRLSKGASVR